MRVFGVVGWKNSGKTGLVVRLISEITRRGYSVSSIKHTHHNLNLARQRRNGAPFVQPGVHEAIHVSDTRWSLVRSDHYGPESDFPDLLARLAPVDLVLVEGYKLQNHPKIEAYRPETGNEIIARRDDTILAVATTGCPEGLACPVFDLDHTGAIADFVLAQVGL